MNLAIASYLIQLHGITNLRVASDSGHGYRLSIATQVTSPSSVSSWPRDWPQ